MKKEEFNEFYSEKDIKLLNDIRSKKLITLILVIGAYAIISFFMLYYALNIKSVKSYLSLMIVAISSYAIIGTIFRFILYYFSNILIEHTRKISKDDFVKG